MAICSMYNTYKFPHVCFVRCCVCAVLSADRSFRTMGFVFSCVSWITVCFHSLTHACKVSYYDRLLPFIDDKLYNNAYLAVVIYRPRHVDGSFRTFVSVYYLDSRKQGSVVCTCETECRGRKLVCVLCPPSHPAGCIQSRKYTYNIACATFGCTSICLEVTTFSSTRE